jgi:hypothetical protein
MKKISLIITALVLLTLFACKKEEKVTLSSNPTPPVLNLESGATIVLKKIDADSTITYTWMLADWGVNVVVTYNLQMAQAGTEFADPVSLGVVTDTNSLTITTDYLNNKLLAMLPDPSVATSLALEFRVMSTVNQYVDASNSPVVTQSITPYIIPVIYPLLFVPGDYQGWNPADSSTSIASVKSNDMYEGYIWFDADNVQFKFTQGPSWDVNWGDDGADGTLDPNGANIVAGLAGYYKLNVNLVAKTYTQLRTQWAVIGDATSGGWDADTPMTYDPLLKVWTVTLDLSAASLKFRANGSWDLNYGDNNANGTLQENGANIAVSEAGNYTVVLNLSQPIYHYQLHKN